MTRHFLKRTAAAAALMVLLSSVSFSQRTPIKNFDYLRSTTTDATKILQAYVEPWMTAFGAGLNGGWYNTAKPHKLLGFDLTFNLNAGVVPESATTYDIGSLGLTTITGSGTAPTVAGSKTPGPQLTYLQTNFQAPEGTGYRYIPVPMVQAGIGLPLGSEVKIRYIPNLKIRGGEIGLWGVGLMHNLTQYLPGDKLLPFDVSLFGGYTKLNGMVPINLQPQATYPQNFSPAVSFTDQKMNLEITAMNISAIASLNLPVVTLYGGLGYAKTSTVINFAGNFPTPTPMAVSPFVQYTNAGVKTGSDFGEIKTEDFSGLRANIGLRLKLAIITIHADYTRAHYNVFSAGLGFSFR